MTEAMVSTPTEEQIRKFWEWFGFKRVNCPEPEIEWAYTHPDGGYYSFKGYPPIDLNNLFKWTKEKLKEAGLQSITFNWRRNGECEVTLWFYSGLKVNGLGMKEEDALFWAIWKVIDKEVSK